MTKQQEIREGFAQEYCSGCARGMDCQSDTPETKSKCARDSSESLWVFLHKRDVVVKVDRDLSENPYPLGVPVQGCEGLVDYAPVEPLIKMMSVVKHEAVGKTELSPPLIGE